MFALLLSGFLVISGCGESDNTQDTEETGENTEENTEENTGETAPDTSVENTDEANTGNPATEENAESVPGDTPAPSVGSPVTEEDIPAPDAAASSRPSTEELLAGERKTLVGIITDATKYSVAIQTPEGISYYLTIPETGVSGNLNYITIGQIATLTYVGTLDDTALLVGISDSGLVTGIYVEEYAFAIKIINAVKAMDMKALSDLTNFPVFLDTGKYDGPINTSGEFEVIDSEKIFSEALVNRIVNYNLFDLELTDAGFVLGGNGAPNITFDIDDDGILGIIGINSAPANDSTKE